MNPREPLSIRPLLLLILCLSTFFAHAADLVVRDFKLLPTDQTAINRETTKTDQNGKTAALIKIYTNLKPSDIYFDNGVLGVVARENKPGQIWLYIPARSQKLQITDPKYTPLQYYFEEEIIAGKTYSMQLTVKGKDITLTASVHHAGIIVDNDSLGLSPVNAYISYGDHRVTARSGSMFYEGIITVSPDGPDRFELQMEDEILKYGEITVSVPDRAEIWFEGRRVGLGEWHARLRGGTYTVELRKQNCESTIQNFSVTPGRSSVIDAMAPIPFKGYLSIEVRPAFGSKIFNADTLVAENRLARQTPVGDYTYTFRRKGYIPVTKTFTVSRNEETADTVYMKRVQYIHRNSFYASIGATYAKIPGVTMRIGCTIANVGIEAGYTLGLTKSDDVYWFQNDPDIYDSTCQYSMDAFTLKLGYQFRFIQRFGIMPQVGYLGQRLRGGTRGNGAMCHNLSVGARCIFTPVPVLGIFITPEYAVPVSVNELYKSISAPAGLSEGGIYITAGLSFNF